MARSDWPSVVALGYVWDPLELEFVPAHQAIIDGETINVNVDGPIAVTATTLPLPTGAATATKQDTGNTTLASSLTELQSILAKLNASLAVTGTFFQTTQPVSGTVAVDKLQLFMASGSASASGNNTLLTPGAGKKLRVSYLSYNPVLAVEAAFRFGASGGMFLRNSVVAGSVIAKDVGDLRYIEGAVDEPLILNLSLAVATMWNVLFVEI